jgi:D-beta-D-heptose 7-phosphate kinase/D-beta-D-heptose 1-phosphate adenosyltransferase
VDYECRKPIDSAMESWLADRVADAVSRCDIVLVSDYDKGVCTAATLANVATAARRAGVRVLVDPTRGGDYSKYRGCHAITPNRLEAGLAVGRSLNSTADALPAAEELRLGFDLEAAVITLDKDGMALSQANGANAVYPTRPRQVYDITGAGDMVLSMLGLALASGADYPAAIRLANIAGGLEVEKFGVATISRDEILRDLRRVGGPSGKVLDRSELCAELERHRRAGQSIAFTNGCFDIIHAGHIQYLEEARAQSDVLVVGLNSDASVRALKGPNRPIQSVGARSLVLAGLQAVDYVTVFDESTPMELIRSVRPDVLIKGADYQMQQVVGGEYVESYGGRVHLAEFRDGFSTTEILNRLDAA